MHNSCIMHHSPAELTHTAGTMECHCKGKHTPASDQTVPMHETYHSHHIRRPGFEAGERDIEKVKIPLLQHCDLSQLLTAKLNTGVEQL